MASKRGAAIEERIFELLRSGNTRGDSARAAGICPDTLTNWCNADSDFSDACKKAESEFVARNLEIIQDEAGRTWQAAAWLLERRRPEEFGRRTNVALDSSGEGGQMLDALVTQIVGAVVRRVRRGGAA